MGLFSISELVVVWNRLWFALVCHSSGIPWKGEFPERLSLLPDDLWRWFQLEKGIYTSMVLKTCRQAWPQTTLSPRDCQIQIVGKIKSCCSQAAWPCCSCQGCTELEDLIRKHFHVAGSSVPAQLRQGQCLGTGSHGREKRRRANVQSGKASSLM